MTRVAAESGVSWIAAYDAVLTEGKRRLIDYPTRFEGVSAIVIDAGATGVPTDLSGIRQLGRTLKQRDGEVRAFFDRPAPAVVRPMRSMDASNSATTQPSDSGTSPTTSHPACSQKAD